MPRGVDEQQRRWYVDGVFEYDCGREEWVALSRAAVLSGAQRKVAKVELRDFDGKIILAQAALGGGTGGGPGGRCVALRMGARVVVVRFPSATMLHHFARWSPAAPEGP